MSKFTFMDIDVNSDAAVASVGAVLAQATAEGVDTNALMQRLASNSARPYIDPSQPDVAYVSINTGKVDEKGMPVYKAVPIGNAQTYTLFRGEWEAIDEEIHAVAMGEQRFVQFLVGKGLRKSLPGMGVTRFTWRNTNGGGEARMDMDLLSDSLQNRPEFEELSIPLPFIHSSWDLNIRELAVSRRGGQPLDTIKAYWAAFAVAQKTEQVFINGAGNFKSGTGNQGIYGIRNTPVALTATLQGDWATDGVTGAEIVAEVADWVQTMKNQHHYGPFTLMVPARYSFKLSRDYRDADTVAQSSVITIRERLLKIEGIASIMDFEQFNIDAADSTKYANEVVLCELKKETITVLDGMPLTNFEWETRGRITMQHMVAQIRVPLFRADMVGQSGLLIAKTTGTSID